MHDREWFDRVLPVCTELRRAANILVKWTNPADKSFLTTALEWLAEQTESDRWPRPAWCAEPEIGYRRDIWAVSMSGLRYKSSLNYMTAEGWPMMTTCWYVTIECGWRLHVAAEEPEDAVARAVIIFSLVRLFRDTHPKERSHKYDLDFVEDAAPRLLAECRS